MSRFSNVSATNEFSNLSTLWVSQRLQRVHCNGGYDWFWRYDWWFRVTVVVVVVSVILEKRGHFSLHKAFIRWKLIPLPTVTYPNFKIWRCSVWCLCWTTRRVLATILEMRPIAPNRSRIIFTLCALRHCTYMKNTNYHLKWPKGIQNYHITIRLKQCAESTNGFSVLQQEMWQFSVLQGATTKYSLNIHHKNPTWTTRCNRCGTSYPIRNADRLVELTKKNRVVRLKNLLELRPLYELTGDWWVCADKAYEWWRNGWQ